MKFIGELWFTEQATGYRKSTQSDGRWYEIGHIIKCSDDTRCLSCSNSLKTRSKMRLEKKTSETGLTRVARLSPPWRKPISPQAINNNTRHNAPPSNHDEWPQESPRALCPVWSCAAHNYCTWETSDSVKVHFILQSLCVVLQALQLCHGSPVSHNWSQSVALLQN